MTQFNLTIDISKLLEEISSSNINEMTKGLLSVILNTVMEEEHNQYIGCWPL